ncbi:MAG: hypothetical protein IPI20_18655 [Rhodoferax sp.]|nr:hypothetical protein [Rhodoferax sp.]
MSSMALMRRLSPRKRRGLNGIALVKRLEVVELPLGVGDVLIGAQHGRSKNPYVSSAPAGQSALTRSTPDLALLLRRRRGEGLAVNAAIAELGKLGSMRSTPASSRLRVRIDGQLENVFQRFRCRLAFNPRRRCVKLLI